MLRNVLSQIASTNLYSPTAISKALSISEEMVDAAVNQLIRMGYLREDDTSEDCDIPCSGCAYALTCKTITVKTFSISEKGQALLARSH